MAQDPNGIALQSTDPDLSVDILNPAQQHGVDEWENYADAVNQWGEDVVDDQMVQGVGRATITATGYPQAIYQSYFHPSHRMATPFIVALGVTIVILILVFIPKG
jgi:hypothetical protein